MKQKIIVIAAALFVVVFAVSCKAKKADGAVNQVTIWTYDSFTGEWGPGNEIAAKFAEETGILVSWESSSDAGSLLARILLEGKDAKADIVLGLDQNFAPRALESGLFEHYKPKNAGKILPDLGMKDDFRLIPYDYSYFAIIYDSETIANPPQSLEDLASPAYKNKLILLDPRTSSPGLGFLGWTIAIYGENWQNYWQRLRPSMLTIAPGWDIGYGLFTKGEAPLVLSYTTSPGYHLEYEGIERYRAALFAEGHPLQTELAGLLAAAPHKENARRFLDFMLTEGFQSAIPLTNWMYPVVDIPLPASFRVNPKPAKALHTTPVTEVQLDEWADGF